MNWIALYSQSGSELISIIKDTGLIPDLILTNNNEVTENTKWLRNKTSVIQIAFDTKQKIKPSVYSELFKLYGDTNDTIITLHGWLKIIPAEVCNEWNIYNGHPGDIVKFPQLKGKDPQSKAFNLKLPWSGSVVHKVTPEVDGGEIVSRVTAIIKNCKTEQEVFDVLRRSSLDSWREILPKLLKDKNCNV